VLNERGKFGAKIFSLYTYIVILVLGYFNLNHPVYSAHGEMTTMITSYTLDDDDDRINSD